MSRRISPGIMPEEKAVAIAMQASSVTVREVASWSARRAGEAKIVDHSTDDVIAQIRRRKS